MQKKRLTKSVVDQQIAGVAGGLAEYFEVDPTLVRLLFVVLTVMGGPGLIIYIILALIMPDDDFDYEPKRKNEELA
jgi:phage shock protein C